MDSNKMVCEAVEPFDNNQNGEIDNNEQDETDQVHAQFVELLKSNKETREELHQASLKNTDAKKDEEKCN
ncbi:Protein of unknown function [Cotesia congregata]|uniref:Uncharacterized protein n=1 Tax=Cotesia congregata TaxID=51543 RepID=A0A8J2GZI3_COTCN|nr:Protein of unknown function [Cotesia congregata]